MVDFYVKLIQSGKKTIDQIPAKWREAVQAALDRED